MQYKFKCCGRIYNARPNELAKVKQCPYCELNNPAIEEVDKLDRDKHYYIYCRSGKRSSQACTLLDQMGFAETYNLAGGFSEWEGEKETN